MWPDRVSNPEPMAHETDALPTALRGPPNRKEAIYHTQQSRQETYHRHCLGEAKIGGLNVVYSLKYGIPRGSKAPIRIDPYFRNTGRPVKNTDRPV